MQAWTMTHYSFAGARTAIPEELSLFDKVRAVFVGVNVPRPVNVLTPASLGLPYDTIHLPGTNTGDSLELWYVGPPTATTGIVIMFPGYATGKDALLTQAVEFYRLGWTPLLVDFHGAGGSTGSNTTLGAHEAHDVRAVLEFAHSRQPEARIVLYGVSMGASAILRAYSGEQVRSDALILESPFDSLLSTVRNRFDAIGFPPFPSAELMVFWGSVQHGFNGFDHNPLDYAASVRCPTLLMYGDLDPRVTAQQSLAIYERLPAETGKQQVVFTGAGHEPLIANDRDKWVDNVGRFLKDPVLP
jgi:alpha-beta hydrolase superfamily lysophospholipase